MAVPRSHGFHDRLQSARLIRGLPTGVMSRGRRRRWAAVQSASPTANSPTATTMTSMPSASSGTPKVSRCCPEVKSIPISPMVRPMPSAARPRTRELPSTDVTAMKASSMIAKVSAGETSTARSATSGATRASSRVAIVPATNDPIAAVARAWAARPLLAILLPSMAVTTDALSPGVFSRIEVVEPPYMPP